LVKRPIGVFRLATQKRTALTEIGPEDRVKDEQKNRLRFR